MDERVNDTAITNIIFQRLKELQPLEYRDILQWMRRREWVLAPPGEQPIQLLNFKYSWFQAQMDDPNNEFLSAVIAVYADAKDNEHVSSSANVDRQSPAEAPQVYVRMPSPSTKKAQTEFDESQPRNNYDDQNLTQLVLDFLKENRSGEYTYNQVADDTSIWCDFKTASRVLRRLKDRGNDVIEYTVKKPNGAKVKVYKYAPERKALDKNYGRSEELVGAAIMEYLEDRGAQSQNAICQALRQYFGYLDKAIVKEVLESMRKKEQLHENVGPRNARVFSAASKMNNTRHFDTHLSGVVGTCRELSGLLVGS